MKRLIIFSSVSVFFWLVESGFSQGTIQFANDSGTQITNCATHLPQAAKTIKIGLYFTPDLSAVSNEAARASMFLAAITTNGTFASLGGRFNGGIVTLPFTPILSPVVLQLKAWPTNYTSFQAAVDAGAAVVESLPWVQQTGGSLNPPTMISRWGFRPFLYPQCEPKRVPLFVERNGSKVMVRWPVGLPPNVQMNDGSSTNWQALTSGSFVQDHWEFEAPVTNGVQLFRLAQ